MTRTTHRTKLLSSLLGLALAQGVAVQAATTFTAVNYALTGTASASSSGYGSTPERVIDGNTDGNWGNNSVWHSNAANDNPTFWEVELDATHDIGRVNVFLRTDCCGERNANLEVVLFDDAHNEIARELHAQNPFTLSPPASSFGVNFAPAVAAHYVRIERNIAPDFMHLAEVQVLAPYADSSINVATGAADTSATEGRTATFGPIVANVVGAPQGDLTIQWQLNGVDIEGASSTSYTTPVLSLSDSGNEYTARLVIGGYSTTTKAKLTVLKDTAAPTVVSAAAIGQTIGIRFSELLDATSAGDKSHYTGLGGVTVTAASVLPGGTSVALTVSGLTGNTFSIGVSGVTDFGGNPVAANTVATGSIDSSLTIEDIGTPAAPGFAASSVPGSYVFYASGNAGDPYADSDLLTFGHSTVVGDFDKRVKIIDIQSTEPTDNWARGGLLARTSLETSARAVALVAGNPSGANIVGGLSRADEGKTSEGGSGWNWVGRTYPGVKTALPNQWLRLRRVGNSFFYYVGVNGQDWSLVGKKFMNDLPDTLEVGLFASSSKDDSLASVAYENYSDVVLSDTVKPTVVSAGTIDKVNIGVKFSEIVSAASATKLSNYTLSQGTVTAAEVGVNGDSVYLTVDGLTSDTFTVTVNNVTDAAGNAVAANSSVSGKVSNWKITNVGVVTDPSQAPSVDNPWINPFYTPSAVALSSADQVEVEVVGAGGDIWSGGDWMHFLYQEKSGDFDFQAEVTRSDLGNGRGGYGHGGIMIRAGLYADGQEYTSSGTKVIDLMNTTYEEGGQERTAIVIWRDAPGGGYGNSDVPGTGSIQDGIIGRFGDLITGDASGNPLPNTSPKAARWLRVKREGQVFISYWSYFGKDWVEYNRHTSADMPNDVLIGFAAQENSSEGSQGKPGNYTVSVLRNFGDRPTDLVLVLGGTVAAPTLSWTDATATLLSAPTVDGPWTAVAGATSPYSVKAGSTAFFRLTK